MVYEFKFPDIGEGVEEGEIIQWFVSEGDSVEEDDPLLEMHTVKVTTEITSPVAGKITKIEHEKGDRVKVGEVLVRIQTEEVTEVEVKKEKTEEKQEKAKEAEEKGMFEPTETVPSGEPKVKQKEPTDVKKRVRAPPAIRRKAREEDIDLHQVKGTGSGGRITKEDLERFIQTKKKKPPAEAPKEKEIIPLRGTRRDIARIMRKSKDKAAHYTYVDSVNMSALDDLKEKAKPTAEEKGVKLTYLPLIIKCLIPALEEFPLLNSSLDEENEEIVVKHYYNIGIAVDTDEGLVVPVVKHADKKSVWQLAKEIQELASQAREGKLSIDDVQGGTFTITNIGPIGGVLATPIIRWPEVAILGVNKAQYRPVVVEEHGKREIAIRKMMYLSLSLDHRVVDGAVGARFTNTIVRYMENPGLLFLEDKICE